MRMRIMLVLLQSLLYSLLFGCMAIGMMFMFFCLQGSAEELETAMRLGDLYQAAKFFFWIATGVFMIFWLWFRNHKETVKCAMAEAWGKFADRK